MDKVVKHWVERTEYDLETARKGDVKGDAISLCVIHLSTGN